MGGMQEMSSANQTGNAEMTQANFDTNMVIILAALLVALICALGLNSMIRCVLRCTRRVDVETTSTRTGLKKSALRKIPVVVYGSGQGSGSECPICLGEFVEGEKVRVLPNCNHGFHVGCIDTWLGSHSSCPNCRHSLVDGGDRALVPPQDGGGRQEHVVVEVDEVIRSS